MAYKDWLVHDHLGFNIQVMQSIGYLLDTENKTRMGFGTGTPGEAFLTGTFNPLVTPYTSAFNIWKNAEESTPKQVRSFVRKESALKAAYRKLYVNFIKNNVLVTDDDLDAMKFPRRGDGSRHPSPIADQPPAVKISTSRIRTIRVNFGTPSGKELDDVKKGKLFGQHGAEICWAKSAVPVTDIEQLVNSAFDTDSPLDLVFKESERGQAVYLAARWENTRGQKGPFSAIQVAYIP
jgi:hypothetical protein